MPDDLCNFIVSTNILTDGMVTYKTSFLEFDYIFIHTSLPLSH